MVVVWIIVSIALVTALVTALVNARRFPRLLPGSPTGNHTVSILVPARNEEGYIGRAIQQALLQDPHEVIVLDDASQESTYERAVSAGAGDPRVKVLPGQPLPEGWSGKNWACHQLAGAATGNLLLFTDADVAWQPGALTALRALLERSGADAVTAWPTYQTDTLAERLTVPLIAMAIQGFLPESLVRHSPFTVHSAGNGQCFLLRREVYDEVGGHAAIRSSVLEDVHLARRVKSAGRRLILADAAGMLTCRMYKGWQAVRDGFAKNILAGHGDRVPLLLLATAFYWALFLLPAFWLLTGFALDMGPGWPWWPLALTAAGMAVRAITARSTRQRPWDALMMPLSVLVMTRIAFRAMYWRLRYGGPQWKGRTVPAHGIPATPPSPEPSRPQYHEEPAPVSSQH